MKITRAYEEDIIALEALVNSAYRGEGSKMGWTTEAEILDGIRINGDALRAMLKDSGVTVLKYLGKDDGIIATVCLEPKGTKLYLGMFAVSPMEQGVASAKK